MTIRGKARMYHLSLINHGPVLTVGRATPSDPSSKEPATPRLCVSPTIAQCLGARMFWPYTDVWVYRTEKPVRGVTPVDVWDACITHERWLLPGQSLQRVSKLDPVLVELVQKDIANWHVRTRQASSLKRRFATIMIALSLTEEPGWINEFVALVAARLKITDPEQLFAFGRIHES